MTLRLYIVIRGAVQGVGFRPFVYRLAASLNLKGFVLNSSAGIFIEAEGEKEQLDEFILKIEKEKPKLAIINSLEFSFLDPKGYENFEIRESRNESEISALILPDIAICGDCLHELFDPSNRRYLYPFINCTNCGPRFSIIESLPYDRPNTSMKMFEMCDSCCREYNDPLDRRFHAQPIACPQCGPNIELWDEAGKLLSSKGKALKDTAEKINGDKIIALKGLGGFQLLADASSDDAVKRLRYKKHREEKPFALMFPSIQAVKNVCEVSPLEERLLLSAESPIVLLRRKNFEMNLQATKTVSRLAAPENPYLGIMLPYTPLHHLLMKEIGKPVIATSGNLSEEPMCIDEFEAMERLKGIADFFLVHNRPIVRHVDDSIVRIVHGREMVLRRARGYAPLPVKLNIKSLDGRSYPSYLALGGHLKSTVALNVGENVFISQHIGDLSTHEAFKTFKKVSEDFQILYKVSPEKIIHDEHPDYLSTKHSKSFNIESFGVQHHYAHTAACRAENQILGSALGVSWDGTGYGSDNTIWGGEFFLSADNSYRHIAQFRKFKLPGGEKAIKEINRSALGILYELYFENRFIEKAHHFIKNLSMTYLKTLEQMLRRAVNSPFTSSCGRLFDAAAALLGIRNSANYEGQAAMMLEFTASESEFGSYPVSIIEEKILIFDWQPMIEKILKDIDNDNDKSIISAKFHNTLAKVVLELAKRTGEQKVLLSGGCFQNAYLLNRTITLLEENNFKVYWHQRVPPNDGGISLGQIAAALSKELSSMNNVRL